MNFCYQFSLEYHKDEKNLLIFFITTNLRNRNGPQHEIIN